MWVIGSGNFLITNFHQFLNDLEGGRRIILENFDICGGASVERRKPNPSNHPRQYRKWKVGEFDLSHKLRCYTGISGSEKSRNNTREKIFWWYSQSAADMSLAFSATRSGWWMNGKAFTILNTSYLSELSRTMATKNLKNPYRWQIVWFKLS